MPDYTEIALKTINTLILCFSLLLFPFVSVGLLFVASGESASYFLALVAIGHLGLIISSIGAYYNIKFFTGTCISILLIISGLSLDAIYWKEQDRKLCEELRAEPSCVEEEFNFTCENFRGGQYEIPKSICE